MLPQPNPQVIFKLMADGAVLFAPNTEIYFGLNEVGARVWQLLPNADGSLDVLCARISEQYPDVSLETIRADVEELLESLVAEGLVTLPGPSEADAGAAAS